MPIKNIKLSQEKQKGYVQKLLSFGKKETGDFTLCILHCTSGQILCTATTYQALASGSKIYAALQCTK
jgi:hypothetical protein